MNINDMLNKPARFTPIKTLMGDLPHSLDVPLGSFKEEAKPNMQQIQPQQQQQQEFQSIDQHQGQEYVYQNNSQDRYSNYIQNPDTNQNQQTFYNSQPPQSFLYQQPISLANQQSYISQSSYDLNMNLTNPIASPSGNYLNMPQNQQQFVQLPKLAIPQKSEEDLADCVSSGCNSASSTDSGRSAPYTLHDDLSIFKVVAAYYGFGFHGKIPWSFWQTYKRATGSTRSNSSLYHHWNGAMKKKYDAFISNGRLNDCILWLETAVMAEQSSNACLSPQMINNGNNIQPVQHAGTPLFHNRSEPPVSLIAVGQPNISQMQPMTLIRTPSAKNESSFPFTH
ncbi:hypothetical protein M9Y10_041853 [Tritrichomonas musculus]|uniref:Myb-like domain-containing protein n=1 Tax=Tritrichomonas musculus TaxID=1915356 RepID=A0ABR2K5M4_9EUKA